MCSPTGHGAARNRALSGVIAAPRPSSASRNAPPAIGMRLRANSPATMSRSALAKAFKAGPGWFGYRELTRTVATEVSAFTGFLARGTGWFNGYKWIEGAPTARSPPMVSTIKSCFHAD